MENRIKNLEQRMEEQHRRLQAQLLDRNRAMEEHLDKLLQLLHGRTLISGEIGGNSNSPRSSTKTLKQFGYVPTIDFPAFNGENSRFWIQRCENYFNLFKIPDDQKVDLASNHMIGIAKSWFNAYIAARVYVSWLTFVLDVCGHFKNELGVNVVERFDILTQTKTFGEEDDEMVCVQVSKGGLEYMKVKQPHDEAPNSDAQNLFEEMSASDSYNLQKNEAEYGANKLFEELPHSISSPNVGDSLGEQCGSTFQLSFYRDATPKVNLAENGSVWGDQKSAQNTLNDGRDLVLSSEKQLSLHIVAFFDEALVWSHVIVLLGGADGTSRRALVFFVFDPGGLKLTCIQFLCAKFCWSCDRLNVGAGSCLVSLASDFVPSFLPLGTSHVGPPARMTKSRAAKANISAHETTPGHVASTAFFALSMTKNACSDRLGGPDFSILPPHEASHPLTKQSWKCMRSNAAGTVLSSENSSLTTFCTILSTLGQFSS